MMNNLSNPYHVQFAAVAHVSIMRNKLVHTYNANVSPLSDRVLFHWLLVQALVHAPVLNYDPL